MNKFYTLLELDKILKLVENETILEDSKLKLENYKSFNNLQEINEELDKVDEAVTIIFRLGKFNYSFTSNIPFILGKAKKMGVLEPQQLVEISGFFDTIKNIKLYVDMLLDNNISCNFFKKDVDELNYPKELNLKIKKIVNQYGEILDEASSTLSEIRRKIKYQEKNIQNKLSEILSKNSDKLSESIVSIRNDRYVIPVKNDYKNSIKGITHDISSSGETIWIEPLAIFQLNNELNSLKEAEKEEIYKILRLVSAEIGEEYELFISMYDSLVDLDIRFAKANYAIKINGSRPKINNNGVIELLKCYHPLLNVKKIVTNNIYIGKDYKGMIITGPNTGGKTVILKTVGLLCLMIKYGLLIPCDKESNINVFDDIFADIGDEQSIEQNLSTFSSHLKNVIEIINNATYNSLILIDELGSGTDPLEGSSLAISIIDYLLKKDCTVITTSHYSELKMHAYNSDNIINASVEFDIETLKPTYKLLIGIPGSSNALKISKILGLNSEIISKAENYVSQKDSDVNKILAKLTNQSISLDNKVNELEEKEEQLNNKIYENELLKEQIICDKNKIIEEAEEKAKKIIKNANDKISAILNDLEEMRKRETKLHEIAEIKGKIKELNDEIHLEKTFFEKKNVLEKDSKVFVENYQCYGIITSTRSNNKYEVQMGNATMLLDGKYLKRVDNVIINPSKKVESKPITIKKDIKSTLDLRGKRYDEAKELLNKFFDDALYGGLSQISIIHGFGTGVIRELVKKFIMEQTNNIESYRFGGQGEGGQGVTIISLKK